MFHLLRICFIATVLSLQPHLADGSTVLQTVYSQFSGNVIGYWPFSSHFGLRDCGPNKIDAVWTNTPGSQVTGPFGAANTSVKVTPAISGTMSYLNWTNPLINLGAQSWTLSGFINTNGATYGLPILEWYNPSGYSSMFWQWTGAYNLPASNTLYFGGSPQDDYLICPLTGGWQYVGITYDNSNQRWSFICNSTIVQPTNFQLTAAPPTTATLLGGHRSLAGSENGTNNAFACVSILSMAINASQLAALKDLCPLFQNYTCPANCSVNSCRAYPDAPNGYTCDNCTSGWGGSDCTTPTCGSGCPNGGTCLAPNVCTCTANWTGTFCTTPICSPVCENGGTCTAPNVCTCTSQWTGGNCTTPICSPSCMNGGTCSAPNVCSCPPGVWMGSLCQYPVCSPACPVGFTCLSPNHCIDTSASLCDSVKPNIGSACLTWSQQEGQCLSNPGFMWQSCQTACTKYASCECSTSVPDTPLDLNCTCGEYAASGLCETDLTIQSNCSYSCGRRLNSNNNCSAFPLDIVLPPHASWSLGPSPPSYFNGKAGYLQSAVIVCDPGFTPDVVANTGMRICDPFTQNLTSGNWAVLNTATPHCLAAACSDPPYIEGSYTTNSTNGEVLFQGDKVTYYCNPGLTMRSAVVPVATCTFSGPTGWTWTDQKPECMLPPCKAIVEGVNTYANISSNQTGGIATYSCLLGFNPVSHLDYFVKTCQNDGTWAPVGQPVCEVVKCGPPNVEANAYLTGTNAAGIYVYGDVVTSHCTTGATSLYIEPGTENTPLPSISNYCSEFATWTRNSLSCLLVQCPTPQAYEIAMYRIMNSSAETQTLLYGMVLAFECDWNQGYQPEANQTSKFAYWRCNENSTWDKEPLLCSPQSLMKILRPVKQVAYESSTAVAFGTAILVILAFFFGVIVCLDYVTLQRDIRRLRHNIRHFTRHLRDKHRLKELHDKRTQLRQKLAKEKFMEQVSAEKERQQLAAAGYKVGDGGRDELFGESFQRRLQEPRDQSWATRPMTADNTARSSYHVEGGMDIPEEDHVNLSQETNSAGYLRRAMTAK